MYKEMTMKYYVFLTIALLIKLSCSFLKEVSQLSYCLQSKASSQLQDECKLLMVNFCSMVKCQSIENCDENDNQAIVQNLTGRGCCPACVRFIKEGERCEISSKLTRCQNNLFCDINTNLCSAFVSKSRCTREAANKQVIKDSGKVLYVKGGQQASQPVYFQIAYATDMDMVSCHVETGLYDLKQCRGSKCFCVEADSGQYTFGLSVKDSSIESAKDMTCKCTDHLHTTLHLEANDRHYMEHYSEVHQKCDPSGNFEPLQCINQTCFCVHPKTGRPDLSRVVIYGALSALPCFNIDKAKQLISTDADLNYQNECERQMTRTQKLSLHFLEKGTKLRGLEKISCSYDGRFADKQCKPELCNCVTPDTCQITMGGITYGVDRSGGKDADMNCRCARQVYYATVENKGYSRLQCEANGNFKAWQSFDDGRETFCVDENGMRISKVFNNECLYEFIRSYDSRLSPEEICDRMRLSLTDRVIEQNKYYVYDHGLADVVAIDHKPLDLFCDHTSNRFCKCKHM